MAEVINLKTARKRAARAAKEQRAAERRMAHGASKAQRSRHEAASDRRERLLDQHHIEPGEKQ